MTAQQETLAWRYATKKFDPQAKISPQDWQDIEAGLRNAPSSLGLQAWKFLIIDTPATRQALQAASYGQSQVGDCSHYVVLCGRKDIDEQDLTDYIQLQKDIRGISDEAAAAALQKYKNYSFFWGDPATTRAYIASQIHLACGFIAHQAAQMRIDTCIIGGMDPAQYDQILQLDQTRYRSILGMAFGYRSPEDSHAQDPKVRYPADKVIQHI